MKLLIYTPDRGVEKDISPQEIGSYLEIPESLIWLDLDQPTETEFEILSDTFNFHPLAIEDCKTKFHLPKIDDYENYLFLIWHGLIDNPETAEIETTKLDIFLGKNFLVTSHSEKIPDVEKLQADFFKSPEFLKRGPDRLLYHLLDRITDDYFPLMDRISETLDRLEDEMFEQPTQDELRRLFVIKHQLLNIRKIIAPQREVINSLARRDHPLIKRETAIYFQDIYDHLFRIIDLIETSRDLTASAMDIYLTAVSNRLNEIMKKLTIVASIFMPLTLISSIYGMNFRYMPELLWPYGYFVIITIMAIIAIWMVIYFKKRQWW